MGVALPARVRSGGAPVVLLVAVMTTLAVLGSTVRFAEISRAAIAVGVLVVGLTLVGVDAMRSQLGPGLPWQRLVKNGLVVFALLLPLIVNPESATQSIPFDRPRVRPLGERSGGESAVMQVVDSISLVVLILGLLALLVYSGALAALITRLRILFSPREAVPLPGAAALPVGDRSPEEARAAALRLAGEALESEDDRRRAVIAAYLALERHLAAVTRRRSSETAREYVTRALRSPASRADHPHVEGLLTVFAAARYSRRPVSDTDVAAARLHLQALVGD